MNQLKKIGGFCKYWWTAYRCVGLTGILMMGMWPNTSGNTIDYIEVWENGKDTKN